MGAVLKIGVDGWSMLQMHGRRNFCSAKLCVQWAIAVVFSTKMDQNRARTDTGVNAALLSLYNANLHPVLC